MLRARGGVGRGSGERGHEREIGQRREGEGVFLCFGCEDVGRGSEASHAPFTTLARSLARASAHQGPLSHTCIHAVLSLAAVFSGLTVRAFICRENTKECKIKGQPAMTDLHTR